MAELKHTSKRLYKTNDTYYAMIDWGFANLGNCPNEWNIFAYDYRKGDPGNYVYANIIVWFRTIEQKFLFDMTW